MHDDEQYQLIDANTLIPIRLGSIVLTFRGQKWKLLSFTPPASTRSTGRIKLQHDDGTTGDYYPGIINARIINTDPNAVRIDQDDLTKEWIVWRIGSGIISGHRTREQADDAAAKCKAKRTPRA